MFIICHLPIVQFFFIDHEKKIGFNDWNMNIT